MQHLHKFNKSSINSKVLKKKKNQTSNPLEITKYKIRTRFHWSANQVFKPGTFQEGQNTFPISFRSSSDPY